MVSKKTRRHGNGGIEEGKENVEGTTAEYEQSREQRIKENLQRMQKLGILQLSRNLKPPPKPKTIRPQKPLQPSSGSPRRSSRIKTIPTISYSEKRIPKEKVIKDVKIIIEEGSQPEVYTEEHEKMLGDHNETWTLWEDGYDAEGHRIYDPYNGKNCHQCRQKTLGLRTNCSKCTSIQGQFCGDCLFMRYGENVVEANANPEWICPVCRDICNCSRCRRVKGWQPTGNVYRKAINLGFKSVAHYLIETRGPHGKQEDEDKTSGEPTNEEDENMVDDGKHVSTEENTKRQQSKGEDDGDDVDPDYESDLLDDDNNDDEEDNLSEDD